MKQFAFAIIRHFLKFITKGEITGKKYSGINKTLYYEKAQHLNFLFQKTIKYEENIQQKLPKYIYPGNTVFDIGGNIGQYAIPFSELVGQNGQVFSFEPDYKNFSFLQFNMNINQCINVSCINCGVGNEDSELDFFRDTETGGRMGSFKKQFVGNNFKGFSTKVSLMKFDTLIKSFGNPNFVKIDVEGFEYEVISGLTIDLPETTFLIEVREETKESVFDFFNKKDYKCLWVDGPDRLITHSSEIPGFANLIFNK